MQALHLSPNDSVPRPPIPVIRFVVSRQRQGRPILSGGDDGYGARGRGASVER